VTQPLTKQDFVFIRRTFGQSQESLASMIGTNQVTWSRWERGITKPIPIFRKRILALKTQAEVVAGRDLCPACRAGCLVLTHRDGATCTLTYECDGCGAVLDKEVG
jgi:DNA-binding XRE family transcriptional regulator